METREKAPSTNIQHPGRKPGESRKAMETINLAALTGSATVVAVSMALKRFGLA